MAWMLLTFCKLLILCALQYSRAITAEEMSPLNVKIKNVIVKPAYLSITLDCNITEEMKNYIYPIDIKNPEMEFSLDLTNCSTEFYLPQHDRHFMLHKGVCVKMKANNKETEHNTCTAFNPEGEKETSAKNVICILHVTAVNCSWEFSEKVPNDTIYSLWLYQDLKPREECQDYQTNFTARQMHCSFKAPNIKSKQKTYLVVEGSSNTTSILFYDKWITLAENEKLNPPRNIQFNASPHGVAIQWEKPHEIDDESCFTYQISLKGEIKGLNLSVKESLSSTSQEFTSSQPFELKMRAMRGNGCYKTEWSAWSETFKFDPPVSRSLTQVHLFVLLAISTVIIVTSLIYVCHRFQLLKKVFPPVPAPVIKLQGLEQDELKGLQENVHSGSEKLPDNEEDIKICEIDYC